MNELIKFMAVYHAEKKAWISKDIEIPEETDGFEFEQRDDVKGLVVFGAKYPLENMDLSIEDHLSVWEAIKNTRSYGSVFNQEPLGEKIYVSAETPKFF